MQCEEPVPPALQTERACEVCANRKGNRLHYPREMMFGWQEEFEYLECGYCGCLQITRVPQDLGRYYPDNYYSYKPPREKHYPRWILKLRHLRTRAYLGERQPLGSLLGLLCKRSEHFEWVCRARLRLGSAILGVGCGGGMVLV
jgi:hypothetical protein